MVWVRDWYKGKQIWYSSKLIEAIKKLCAEHKAIPNDVLLKLIEDAGNET